VEAALPPAIIDLAFENFSGFHFASLEHNASSAERILSAPPAKIRIIPETCKHFGNYFVITLLKLIVIRFGSGLDLHNHGSLIFFQTEVWKSWRLPHLV